MDLTLRMIVGITLKATIALLMVSLGLQTSRADLLQLWRRPRLLAGSLIAAFAVVPVAAYLVTQALPLPFEARVGLWVIAITPGAPMIYRGALVRRGLGDPKLAASYQVTVALLVIVLAPVWLAMISLVAGSSYWIPPKAILAQVAQVQLIPIAVGLVIRQRLPEFAEFSGKLISKIAEWMLAVVVVVLLAVLAPWAIVRTDLWTTIGAAVIALAATAGGHLLAGPDLASRVTIANANAQRNPGLALAIAAWNLPEHRGIVVLVILIYALVSTAAAAAYTAILRRTRPS